MANIPALASVYEGKNVRIQSGDNATLLATVDSGGNLTDVWLCLGQNQMVAQHSSTRSIM